jgi:hypothetical protein
MVLNDYILGIIFSIGYISRGRLIFKNKNKYFLEQIQRICGNNIYKQKDKNNVQYVLSTKYFNIEKLKDIGWSSRNSDIRQLPRLKQYGDFLRAYIELHSRFDYCTRYKNKQKKIKYKSLRLRIYGNKILIREINKILNMDAGTTLKSPQNEKNNKTSCISYTSINEIKSIFRYIEENPCFDSFWKEIENKLIMPVIV